VSDAAVESGEEFGSIARRCAEELGRHVTEGRALAVAASAEIAAERARAQEAYVAARQRIESGAEEHLRQELDALSVELEGVRSAHAPGPAAASWSDGIWQPLPDDPPEIRPDLWRLGRVDTDGLMPGIELPFLVPLLGTGNLVLRPPGGSPEAREALQGLLVRLLASVASRSLQLLLHDPAGAGRNLGPLVRLDGRERLLVGGAISYDADTLHVQLEQLWQATTRRHARGLAPGTSEEPWLVAFFPAFPAGFDQHAAEKLVRVMGNGADCGVHCVVAWDDEQLRAGRWPDPSRAEPAALLAELSAVATPLPEGKDVDITLDPSPACLDLAAVTDALADRHSAGLGGLTLAGLAPSDTASWGTQSSCDGITAPVGADADGVPFELSFNDGNVGTMLAGTTGVGKSRLLHAIITSFASRYSPSELEFYLLDFKGGQEFLAYGDTDRYLPHAEILAAEADRTFGLSVLRQLRDTMAKRQRLLRRYQGGFREYRSKTGEPMPRILVILDELKEFLQLQDDLAREGMQELASLARQGRSVGIHLLLCTQTFEGLPQLTGLLNELASLIKSRIAMQMVTRDGVVSFLGIDAPQVRSLGSGEALFFPIHGDLGSAVEFTVAEATDEAIPEQRRRLHERFVDEGEPPYTFLGEEFASLLDTAPGTGDLSLGLPIEVGDPVGLEWFGEANEHVAIVGSDEKAALGLLQAAALGLARNAVSPDARQFVIINMLRPDQTEAAGISPLVSELVRKGHHCEVLRTPAEVRSFYEAAENGLGGTGETVVIGFGLHRFTTVDPSAVEWLAPFGTWLAERAQIHRVHMVGWWANFRTYQGVFDRQLHAGTRVMLRMDDSDRRTFFNDVDLQERPKAVGDFRAYLLDIRVADGPVQFIPFGPLTSDQWTDIPRWFETT
jgi:hypothetical protein